MKELKVGIPFPFYCKDAKDEFDSKTLVGQKPLVIYFIQKIHQDVQLKLVVLEIYTKILGSWGRSIELVVIVLLPIKIC
jgi:hypothetical protein